MKQLNLKFALPVLLTSAFIVAGCGGSSSTPTNKSYRVTLSNVTANQPLSPAAVIIHKAGYQAWRAGKAASVSLEKLAEGGSNQALLDEANNNADVIVTGGGDAVIPPGGSQSVALKTAEKNDLNVTVAAMLVNTNDAFTGVSTDKIGSLQKGESIQIFAPVWDAGTEANSEAAGSLPGPVDGGEGFNAERSNDVNFVAIHQGVVTHADGLATSVLGESHRFNNPGAFLKIERVE